MPLMTIMVPTRNRCDTLEFALRTLTAIDDDRLEIVVSDNASVDATRDVVAANGDPRIRYVNTGRPTGMAQNWEFALAHARGDWVGYLGDDDGMLPDALDRVRAIIAETGVRAVRGAPCNYQWPSLRDEATGLLHVPVSRGFKLVDAHDELDRVLRGEIGYFRLPVPYNGGFVERAVLENARDRAGQFYLSQVPDVYSAIIIAHQLGRYAWSHEPLALNGASIHSTGSAQFTRSKDDTRQKAIRTFAAEDNIPFHAQTPLNRDGSYPRSLQVVVFESWHQARERFPDIADIPPRSRLDAILRGTPELAPIGQWLQDFADRHGLSLAEASQRVAARRAIDRVKHLFSRLWAAQWHSSLASDAALSNVLEATRTAASLIAQKPSPTVVSAKNFMRLFRKVAQVGFRRLTGGSSKSA